MATFTITSNTDMDALTGKGGDDVYNINGAILTVNTDSRWGKNTTNTTGPFGTMTLSATLGGDIVFDGTQVWYLPFDNGAGVVPAAGDTITGSGGCTGELIGVWTAINVVPETAGAAMPTTGFIKLKSKTTTFSDNEALTGTGMTADVNSSTGGRRGYLELVGVETRYVTIARLNQWAANGDWFELDDTTTGTPGQIVQLPCSGGTNTYWPGIEIETGVGTGVYEQYPAIYGPGNSGWTNTEMGTDDRCKFVECLSSGRVRIGSDGTNDVGYTPVSGLRMRIPNLLFQNTNNANRAIDVIPSATITDRYEFSTNGSGNVSMDKVMIPWCILLYRAYLVEMEDTFYFDFLSINGPTAAGTINRCSNGNFAHYANAALLMQDAASGFTVTNNKFGRTGTIGSGAVSLSFVTCQNLVVSGNITGPRKPRTAQNPYAENYVSVFNSTVSNETTIGNGMNFAACNGVTVTNQTYFDRYLGDTTALTGAYGIFINGSTNTIVDGLILDTSYGEVAPYLGLYYASSCKGLRIRNIGTFASPVDCNATNGSSYILGGGSSNYDVFMNRVYATNLRTGAILSNNANSNVQAFNVFGNYGLAMQTTSNSSFYRGCGASNSSNAQTAIFGFDFNDLFDSTTTGLVSLTFNEATDLEPWASSYTITGGTPRFTSASSLTMQNLADEIVYEMQYYAIGHTGFQNVNPTKAGTLTTNVDLEYDIDVNDGNGFTGSYTAMTGANLSAETIDPILGFKLRIRLTVNTADATTVIRNILIPTTSTTTTQAYQYPLDNYTLTFAGLETGTKIAVLSPGTETLLEMLTESGGSATFDFNSDQSGTTIDYAILVPGFEYIRENGYVLPTEDTTLNFVQVPDIVYDAAETALVTFDGSTHTIQMDVGSTELNVVGMYAEYIDWAMLSNNLRFDFAFTGAGGNDIDVVAGTSIPKYAFLTNGWRISPDEDDHQLDVTTGILVVDGGGNPFNNTVGGYNVQINYQQPVQAITVNTSSTPPGLTLNQFLALK